jgi:glycosyltransferase involved in cell wall biosynthesis
VAISTYPSKDFPLRGDAVVCLAGEDWWYHPVRSRRHIMTRLARNGCRVLFVNSIGMRVPSMARHAGFFERILRKSKSWMRGLRHVEPNLSVFSPISLPGGGGDGWKGQWNRRFLALQIQFAMRRCGIANPILVVGLPVFAGMIGRLGERLVVYHASDRFDAYHAIDSQTIAQMQEQCIRFADMAIVVSEPLAKMARDLGCPTEIVTHGVDFEHFAQARKADFAEAPELADIPHPRLGYTGAVEVIQDIELIGWLAERHRDWHLVFVGPDPGGLAPLRAHPNIHFLPACPYSEVPRYLKGFDLCMIPRKQDAWVMHSNPLKFKEYLAAGREVVATEIPALRDWSKAAWLATDWESFEKACCSIIERGKRKNPDLSVTALESESWEAKAWQFARYISRFEKDRQHGRRD